MAERMKMTEAVDRIGELARETMQLENMLQALEDDYFNGVADAMEKLSRCWVNTQHSSQVIDGVKQAVSKRIEMNYNDVADVLRAAGWTEPPPTKVEAAEEIPF